MFLNPQTRTLLVAGLFILWIWRRATFANLLDDPFPLASQFLPKFLYLYRLTLFKFSLEVALQRCCRRNWRMVNRNPRQAVCGQCLKHYSLYTFRSSHWRSIKAWRCGNCQTDLHCQPNIKKIEIRLDYQRKSTFRRLVENGVLIANGLLLPGPGSAEQPWAIDFDAVTIGRVNTGDVKQFLVNCEVKGKINRKSFKNKTCYLLPEYQKNNPHPADIARLKDYFGRCISVTSNSGITGE